MQEVKPSGGKCSRAPLKFYKRYWRLHKDREHISEHRQTGVFGDGLLNWDMAEEEGNSLMPPSGTAEYCQLMCLLCQLRDAPGPHLCPTLRMEKFHLKMIDMHFHC